MAFDPSTYKQSVKDEWQRAADGWHRWIPSINAWLHTPTELMLDCAGVKEGFHVLDIAAGDGGQSVAAAQRVGVTGEVLATDIAPNFVELARQVAARTGLKQVKAEVMDAENLELADDSFDSAISRLGLMYLPKPTKGLREIKRVLRQGGHLSVIVFTTPENTPFFSIPVKLIRERRGLPPPHPGQPGPFSLGGPGVLASLFKEAGFQEVAEDVVEAPLRFADTAECVRWRREASGTMQQMLQGLDDTAQEEIWQEIEQALQTYETPKGFESPCELLICSGMK